MSDLTLFTVTYNDLSAKLPRLLYSIDKLISNYTEHLIWVNDSRDGTQEWLLDLNRPKTTVICSDVNIHDLPAYNALAKRCRTKYFMAINPNTRIIGPFDIDAILKHFDSDPKLLIAGNLGPKVKFSEATPHGIEGWGWVSRLVRERGYDAGDVPDTSHVQTFAFFANTSHFLKIGGFDIRNQRFDMRWPEQLFPEEPVDLSDKGNLIAAEIELSVRARRLGYNVSFVSLPFYHYFSVGKQNTVEELDAIDCDFGFTPLGYQFGTFGEDKYFHREEVL